MPAGAKRRRRNGRHEIRRLFVDTITAFGNLSSVERVRDHIELEHRKRKQRVSGRSRESFVLLGGQRRQAMPRHRSDNDPRPACNDHVAKFLKHECRAVEVDVQDGRRRCLRKRDAGSVDDTPDLAETASSPPACKRLRFRLASSPQRGMCLNTMRPFAVCGRFMKTKVASTPSTDCS